MSRLTFICSWIQTGRTYKSLLSSNESFQHGKLKFLTLLGTEFPTFTVLLQYLLFKFKKIEDAEIFTLFSERHTAVGIRIEY